MERGVFAGGEGSVCWWRGEGLLVERVVFAGGEGGVCWWRVEY